jgi:hypothetical protein
VKFFFVPGADSMNECRADEQIHEL